MVSDAAYASAAKHLLRTLNLYEMKWRQHGLGMLQAEIDEELRVHIWHPKLRTLPFEGYRDVHDHRFTLTSFVAVGEVVDIPHTVVIQDYPGVHGWDKYPEVDVYEIIHAKVTLARRAEAPPGAGCSTASDARHLGKAWVKKHEPTKYEAGDVYSIQRRDFHTTRLVSGSPVSDGLAITVVHRADFDGKLARVLGLDAPGDVGSAIVPESLHTKILQEWILREAKYAIADMK